VKLAAFKENVNALASISAPNIANVKIAKIWINLKILKLSMIQE
jgi:hypothetical protein